MNFDKLLADLAQNGPGSIDVPQEVEVVSPPTPELVLERAISIVLPILSDVRRYYLGGQGQVHLPNGVQDSTSTFRKPFYEFFIIWNKNGPGASQRLAIRIAVDGSAIWVYKGIRCYRCDPSDRIQSLDSPQITEQIQLEILRELNKS